MTGNIQIDQLVRSLLQKESLEQCSLQELEQFAGRHPYFGAAQLLLAKKMQLEQAAGYHDQLQKTYMFFNNPLWVQKLLGETGDVEIIDASPDTPTHEAINGKSLVEEPPPSESVSREFAEPVVAETVVAESVSQTEENGGLTFEPYHTVDYFASQGIKFKAADAPDDKFGKQLKSFTDWLKTMKRLPISQIVAGSEPAAEKKVEQMAERSLEEKDVVTEAMAEVWHKQGNHEKAKEVYTKLSLLDPSKSAYFAAKIEALQKQ